MGKCCSSTTTDLENDCFITADNSIVSGLKFTSRWTGSHFGQTLPGLAALSGPWGVTSGVGLPLCVNLVDDWKRKWRQEEGQPGFSSVDGGGSMFLEKGVDFPKTFLE